MNTFARLIASFGGIGFLPWMPGTWGSLAALVSILLSLNALYVAIVVCLVAGVCASHFIIQCDGTDLDPSWIVIDEVVGILIVVAFLKIMHLNTLVDLLIGFGLFRLFDIVKWGPVRWADEVLGANPRTAPLGIMLDDVFAAIYACIVLYVIHLM